MPPSAGVFAVSRAVFDHPAFAAEPFTEREAWLFLIAEAAWRPVTVRVTGRQVDLKRGQCAYSVRFLAERWKWSKSRVDRFLGRLKIGTMVTLAAGQGVNVITICNYDEYQRVALPQRDSSGTPSGTAAGQQRDKEESIETLKEDILSETGVPDTGSKRPSNRSRYPADFEAAWRAYPTDKLMSKKKAAAAWDKIGAEDRTRVAAAIPAFVAYCRAHPDYRPVHMVRFITEARADGFLDAEMAATAADWQKRLEYGRAKKRWATSEWGPMPGRPGCLVPSNLIQPGDAGDWIEWSSQKSAA